MALGERIRECRQNAGMSQEKLAERMGVTRQAVTKWETNQSAPSTNNLFKLAELFGTTVDMLLEPGPSPAERVYDLLKKEAADRAAAARRQRKRNALTALAVAAVYLAFYFLGRLLWCGRSDSSLMGWLFTVRPSGAHSYLYGWLLSSGLFWVAMALSVIPALGGKQRFSWVTLSGFLLGIPLGIAFGPDPEGAAYGHGDYSWAIWGGVFLLSVVAGILAERLRKKETKTE